LLFCLGSVGRTNVSSAQKNNAESWCGRVVPAARRKLLLLRQRRSADGQGAFSCPVLLAGGNRKVPEKARHLLVLNHQGAALVPAIRGVQKMMGTRRVNRDGCHSF